MDIPRIVIGGTNSRAGKAVISIGLMRALSDRGYEVQPFKAARISSIPAITTSPPEGAPGTSTT